MGSADSSSSSNARTMYVHVGSLKDQDWTIRPPFFSFALIFCMQPYRLQSHRFRGPAALFRSVPKRLA